MGHNHAELYSDHRGRQDALCGPVRLRARPATAQTEEAWGRLTPTGLPGRKGSGTQLRDSSLCRDGFGFGPGRMVEMLFIYLFIYLFIFLP